MHASRIHAAGGTATSLRQGINGTVATLHIIRTARKVSQLLIQVGVDHVAPSDKADSVDYHGYAGCSGVSQDAASNVRGKSKNVGRALTQRAADAVTITLAIRLKTEHC